ncbi:hypothetical protein [Sinorhizobium psoraleae]|uniref:SGNH hydrolase-type esterase domain-containing protein n=1 Tax=Sinorhizobium psoraleae TaxID=520838 RepID=A0ABT4KJZ3_9HYPH|nr:hypothetical protein [Sinorhizobium psoraleae]MCZ4092268.1 hypothetical protein [Sinorhizobium psoraleae]
MERAKEKTARKTGGEAGGKAAATDVGRGRRKGAIEETGPASVFLEKDPAICLVYHVKDAQGRYLTDEQAVRALQSSAVPADTMIAQKAAGLRVCADGDSWINILWPLSALAGYAPTFFDILEGRYYAQNVAYPGDTFEQMRQKKDYRQLVNSASFDFFIFSGGGNDILGGGALTELLRPRTSGTSSNPSSFLRLDILDRKVRSLEDGYSEIARDVAIQSAPKRTRMLVHGYDVPKPVVNGPWLGQPFTRRGFNLSQDGALIEGILTHLVDRLYDMLDRIERAHDNVTVVRLKNVVQGRWNDELHPKKAASQDLAQKFVAVLEPSV